MDTMHCIHHALVKYNATILYFGGGAGAMDHPITITTGSSQNTIASEITVQEDTFTLVPSTRAHDRSTNKKWASLESLHCCLSHQKCHTLLDASKHNFG